MVSSVVHHHSLQQQVDHALADVDRPRGWLGTTRGHGPLLGSLRCLWRVARGLRLGVVEGEHCPERQSSHDKVGGRCHSEEVLRPKNVLLGGLVEDLVGERIARVLPVDLEVVQSALDDLVAALEVVHTAGWKNTGACEWVVVQKEVHMSALVGTGVWLKQQQQQQPGLRLQHYSGDCP